MISKRSALIGDPLETILFEPLGPMRKHPTEAETGISASLRLWARKNLQGQPGLRIASHLVGSGALDIEYGLDGRSGAHDRF